MDGNPEKFQLWPGLMLPLGLTLGLGLVVWLFLANHENGVTQRREVADSLALAARRGAAEIAGGATATALEFVTRRRAAWRAQELALRMEAKLVLEAVCQRLTLALAVGRAGDIRRRPVGRFPAGFEAMRRFLELADTAGGIDRSQSVVQAIQPELQAALPAGFGLSLVEDHARELLLLGGADSGVGRLTVVLTRDLIFNDGGQERRWTLRLSVGAPEQSPLPDAPTLAEELAARVGDPGLVEAAWRGWLIDATGPVAAFPATPSPASPPYLDVPGEWQFPDPSRMVWLERPRGRSGLDWDIGVSVAIPAPPAEVGPWVELWESPAWCLTLAGFSLASLAAWMWLAHGVPEPASRRRVEPPPSASQPAGPVFGLRRDPRWERMVPENSPVILAKVGEGGKVSVSTPPVAEPDTPRGSLYRLQAMHRGRDDAPGSRILDQAKSPIIREMAERVRPKGSAGENTPEERRPPRSVRTSRLESV